jgi:hypothetical protein
MKKPRLAEPFSREIGSILKAKAGTECFWVKRDEPSGARESEIGNLWAQIFNHD